jgi:hypothetical protein
MSRPCDIHGICGRYRLCTYGLGGAPVCSCPEGFVVANAGDWSKGCRREFDVRCGEAVDIAPMPVADFWGFDYNYTEGLTYDTCRQICLDDCNCQAFGYKKGVGQCYPKIALFSGRISDFRQVMYLKVPRRVQKFDPSVHGARGQRQHQRILPPKSHTRQDQLRLLLLISCGIVRHGGRLHRRRLPVRVPSRPGGAADP